MRVRKAKDVSSWFQGWCRGCGPSGLGSRAGMCRITVREQRGRDGWTQAQPVPAPQGWAGEGISWSWKCILWEVCPSAQAHPFSSQTLPGGSVHVRSLVRLLPSPILVFCTQGSPAADVLFEYILSVTPVRTVAWPLWFLSCWFLQNLNLGGEGAAVQTHRPGFLKFACHPDTLLFKMSFK